MHLADPIGGHEPRDQDRGIRQVELPAHVIVPVRQGREHAGESNRGQQNQSIVPLVVTSAAVCSHRSARDR